MSESKKKAPTARVIAAKWVHDKLVNPGTSLDPSSLSNFVGSRVNDKKAGKVREQIQKMTAKFAERMHKIIDKYENPPPAKKKGVKPNFAKKS